MNELVFLGAAALTLLGSVMVFAFRNTVYSVVALISALSGVAVLYFQMGATFIGALQIILYAGAILVLFLFVVMLLNVHRDEFGPERRTVKRALAMLLGLVLLVQLLLLGHGLAASPVAMPVAFGTANRLAEVFFSKHVLAFELTSFLLLAAMIGAVLLARPGAGEEA
jgi:NADH-quinone oxidoreductase subunit J